MSSLVANQVKSNMSLVSFKSSLLFALLLSHCPHLTDSTIIITNTACPTQLFAILLTTVTVSLDLHMQLVTRLIELQLTD